MAVLGIDIGGTKSTVAVADDRGSIIAQAVLPTPRERGAATVLAAIEQSLRDLIAGTGTSLSDVNAVGIACGGPLDPKRGIILTVPNLPGWENLPLAAHFESAFGAPAYLDNDVTLAALGEAREGAGAGIDNFACFNIGTGIGGGIIIGGELYRGSGGNAGEFGHQIILPDGPMCACGQHGCLEALASGTSVARRAREALSTEPDSLILRYAGDLEAVTAIHVADAARDGDALALRIWRETGEFLGLGVANVVNILNPRRVILGGGVMKAADLFLDQVCSTVQERAMTQLAEVVEIVPSALGDDAGIVGAIHLALERK